MKIALIGLSLLLSTSCFGKVTKKDIKKAKQAYLNEQNQTLRQSDSIYYRGLIAIKHDQKVPFFLRKKPKMHHTANVISVNQESGETALYIYNNAVQYGDHNTQNIKSK